MRRDGTKLLIEELPMRRFSGDSYNRAVPASLLTSLKLARPTPPLTTHLASLKSLLLQARNLEVLHYQDRGQGTQFAFQEGERLPPYKDLRLRSYDWDHSAEDVRQHWDFSRLQSLELNAMPCFGFLDSIDFGGFPNLQSLHVEDWSPHRPHGREEATRLLGVWIKNHLRGLKSLKITCHIELFPIDAILVHASTLEVLHVRDHVGFRDDHEDCPTMDLEYLTMLAKRLKWLTSLVIDVDPHEHTASQSLEVISEFPRLETLTIHTQSVVGSSRSGIRSPGELHSRGNVDWVTATNHFSAVCSCRSANGMKPLREMTVNMGDWKPIMVRRLGAMWRALNRRGIFAERCFVWKRVEGEYKGWEERSVETQSPRATPDPLDYSEEEDEVEYDDDDN